MNHKHYRRILLDSFDENSLQKGSKGDWQKEGYKIHHVGDPKSSFDVIAVSPKGETIGKVNIGRYETKTKPNLVASNPIVHKDHRRKGIASAMYQYAEKVSGGVMKPDVGLTLSAKQMWAKPNRPFGGKRKYFQHLISKSELKKAPFIHEHNAFAASNIGPYIGEDSELESVTNHKGYKVYKYKDGDYHYFAIHKDNDPKKEVLSSATVSSYYDPEDPNFDENEGLPYIEHAATLSEHQGKGMGTAIHEAATKHFGTLLSSTALSPGSDATWKKMRANKNIKLKIGRGESSPYIAKWIKKPKINKTEDLNQLAKGFEELFGFLAKAKKNIIYIATDGDNIGASVERAALSNDIKEIKKQDKIIKRGNQTVRKWIKKRKGSIYIDGGDDISFTIHKKYLDEIEELRNKYHEATGYTITVGIGDSISEAAHAMVYGKLKGKNQVNRWTSEIESIISQHDKKPESAEEKYQKEGLLVPKKI